MLNDKPWLSRDIRKSIKIRSKIYKQYCKENLFPEQFKTYRNKIVALKRISREDTKRIWSATRTTANVKHTNKYQPSSLVIENKTVLKLKHNLKPF